MPLILLCAIIAIVAAVAGVYEITIMFGALTAGFAVYDSITAMRETERRKREKRQRR